MGDEVAGQGGLAGGAWAGALEVVQGGAGVQQRVAGAAVALLSTAPSFIALGRRARSRVGAWAALAAAAGTTILGLTSITSIINGHDLALFNVLAPVTNAAWLLGSIILAVSLKRARTVPAAVAIGLPLTWVATIPLGTVGGGVIAGAYYLMTGYLMASDAIERVGRAATQPSTA